MLLQGFIDEMLKIRIFRSVWLHSVSAKGGNGDGDGGGGRRGRKNNEFLCWESTWPHDVRVSMDLNKLQT